MWEIKEYSDSDLNNMIEMIKEYYGDIEISKEKFLRHQYFMNPAGNALIKLAYDTERPVLAGQYITNPMRIHMWGQDYNAILSLNTLTRESYKGQKIFTTLAETMFGECENTKIQFCYGLPNQNSYWGFLNKLKFKEIGILPLYLKIMSPSQLVKSKLHCNILSQVCKPMDYFFRTKSRSYKKYEIVNIDKNNVELMDVFWDLIKNKYPIMLTRDKQFITWRYIDIPVKKYAVSMILESKKPVGYAVQRIDSISNIKCGMITDFLIMSGKKDAGECLLNYVIKNFSEANVALSGCLMQTHFEEAEILRKAGYFVCPKFLEPQPFPVILRTFNKQVKELGVYNFKNWFFTIGDYDAI